jgi:hypothetical protein
LNHAARASPALTNAVNAGVQGISVATDPGGDRTRRRDGTAVQREDHEMAERIGVEQARQRVSAGEAMLVCAYDDEQKCNQLRLDGAMSLRQFEGQVAGLPKDREIIFYCA